MSTVSTAAGSEPTKPDWPFAQMADNNPGRLAAILSNLRPYLAKDPHAPIIDVAWANRTPPHSLRFMKSLALMLSYGRTSGDILKLPAIALAGQDTVSKRPSTTSLPPLLANRTMRQVLSAVNPAQPPVLSGPPAAILISRNPSSAEDRGQSHEWTVNRIDSITPAEVDDLVKQIEKNIAGVRAPDSQHYTSCLLALCRAPNVPVDVVTHYAYRNLIAKLRQRLRTVDRALTAPLADILASFAVSPVLPRAETDFLSVNVGEVVTINLEDEPILKRIVRSLERGDQKVRTHHIEWKLLWMNPSLDFKSQKHATFSRQNVHIWCALLCHLLDEIRLRIDAIHTHDSRSTSAPMSSAEFKDAFTRLSAASEGLYQFFSVRGTTRSPDSTLPHVLSRLLGVRQFGFADVLDAHAREEFRHARRRGLPAAVPFPWDVFDDADAELFEDAQTAMEAADFDSSDMIDIGSVVKCTLNNLSDFIPACRTVIESFRIDWKLSALPPTYAIQGVNMPNFTLTDAEMSTIRAWLESKTNGLDVNQTRIASFYKTASGEGFARRLHCEAIIMGLVSQATTPRQLCPTQCGHFDYRCDLFHAVDAHEELWNVLKNVVPTVVCTKKACCHCYFCAAFGENRPVNTDGSHGIAFKTTLFGLKPDAERLFSLAMYNSILSEGQAPQSQQSSPNSSQHGEKVAEPTADLVQAYPLPPEEEEALMRSSKK